MYDCFIGRIVSACGPGGSYLDVGCNTGYFPVKACLDGVRTAVGVDLLDHSEGFQLLTEITGSQAKFARGGYDPNNHILTIEPDYGAACYDVVSSSALLCHVPDPLHFLKALATRARKAIFLWSGFIDSQELLIRYNAPNRVFQREFPNGFDDGTALSTGLLFLAMDQLGFPNCDELKSTSDWLPENWHLAGIPQYQKFRAFLFSK